jgi:hypothetical protein
MKGVYHLVHPYFSPYSCSSWIMSLAVICGDEYGILEVTDPLLQGKCKVPHVRDLAVNTHEMESYRVAFNFSKQEPIPCAHQRFLKLNTSWLNLYSNARYLDPSKPKTDSTAFNTPGIPDSARSGE